MYAFSFAIGTQHLVLDRIVKTPTKEQERKKSDVQPIGSTLPGLFRSLNEDSE